MRRSPHNLRLVGALAISVAAVAAPAAGADQDSPALDAAVVRFCEEHAGEKVGDGECSAVAEEALKAAGAKTSRDFGPTGPDGEPVWGEPVERFEDVLPGDVLQFRDVKIVVQAPSGVRSVRTYPHHTAIVARNRGGGRLDLYEQNVTAAGTDAGRRAKMRRRETDFRGMVEGSLRIYRPVRKDVPDEGR